MGLGQQGSAEAILRIGHKRYVCCSGLHFISYLFFVMELCVYIKL